MISSNDVIDQIVIDTITTCPGNNVFDYGCGQTDLVWKINSIGKHIVAYDVDERAIEKQLQKARAGDVDFLYRKDFLRLRKEMGNSWDVVNCSLVLCSISKEKMVDDVVKDLHFLLKNGGFAVVSICNPLSVFKKESQIQLREIPPDVSYSNHFAYHKKMKSTGNTRKDFHRPMGYYENLFLSNGFSIDNIEQTKTDEYGSSDFLVFKLKKVIE